MKSIDFLPENFIQIRDHLQRGNLVIFATESSYGISGDIFIPRTIKRAQQIKKRNLFEKGNVSPQKAFLCLVSQFSEIQKWGDVSHIPPEYWDQAKIIPTTFLLPKTQNFPDFYFPDFSKIGIRKILYRPLEGFLYFYKNPIFSTSANFSGEDAIYNEKVLEEKFSRYRDVLIVKSGNLKKNSPSQIVDVEKGGIKILRKYH